MSNTLSMNKLPTANNDAWYRHFYVWLIIFLPACAVVASFATLYLAASNPPDLVVADYSNIEATVAKNVAQDEKANTLALRAEVVFGSQSDDKTAISVMLHTNDPQTLPSSIMLRVVHSTLASMDANAELGGSAGRYSGSIKIPTGNYEILLQDKEGTWRLTSKISGQPKQLRIEAPGAAATTMVE